MLPKNFDFTMLPPGSDLKLSEIGLLSSTIETIDYSITEWLTDDLKLAATTNEGWKKVPVLWQSPERSFQIKNDKDLRDIDGAFKLPLISIERTTIIKDPARKGSFQAHTFSNRKDGRSGRVIIAKRIVQDKTRNFAVVENTRRANYTSGTEQRHYPRINKKIVIQTLSIPIPVYVNIEYKISIKTEYQQQMNQLVTPFISRTGQINSFILNRDGHKYEAFIEQNFAQSNNVANLAEENRMYTTDITIRVLGYLIGEGENDDRQLVKVEENFVEITFPMESTVKEDDEGFFKITS
jgi:hypothetical protein